MCDLTDNTLDKYFSREMHKIAPDTSCALKHLLAYEAILNNNYPGALILEDDIILHKNFRKYLYKSLQELTLEYNNKPCIISYEDTRLRFIPRSKRKPDKCIYKGDRDRMTGAYYITKECVQLILNDIKVNKISTPIDLYHNSLQKENKIIYLWCQPTVATQGSAIGRFKSQITIKSRIKPIKFRLQLIYKKILYNFR